jgi:ring-1,2-phenylacetyl-CoA epoxidase subunit PaaE
MSLHFQKLTVSDIRKETADCVSIAFTVPDDLTSQFQFKEGQYITLRSNINGEDIRRSYSICSSPLEKELRIAVKKVPNGIFSTYANEQLTKGDILEVMPPIGKFNIELDATHNGNYVAFASGSGITPVISIIKTVLSEEPKSRFTLVYGNKNRHSIIFKETLEALKNRYMYRFRVVYILSRERTDADIHFGRIDAEKFRALSTTFLEVDITDAFFLCGPEEMTLNVQKELEVLGVAQKKIHIELFRTAHHTNNSGNRKQETGNDQQNSNITIKLDGVSFDFDLPYNGSSILDAALKQGADLPFACKGGVCCTCKAKLIEGEVEMDVNYGLEPDEIENGFILTCQSHPRTNKVVVDFDQK